MGWGLFERGAKENLRYFFYGKTKVQNRTFLVSMDDTSLNTNITQNEGIEIVCSAYEKLHEATHLFLHITWEKLNA